MQIEYKASAGKNTVWAKTAEEAVRLFLATYKNHSFYLSEWRDGRHFFQICGDNSTEENCLHISFKNRKEAQAYLEKQKAMAA